MSNTTAVTDRRQFITGTVTLGAAGIAAMQTATGSRLRDFTQQLDPSELTIRESRSFDGIRDFERIDDSTFLVATEGQVIQIDSRGDIDWGHTTDETVTEVAIGDSGIFVGTNGGVERLTRDGTRDWLRPVGSVRSIETVADGVCALTNREVLRTSPDGTEQWTKTPSIFATGVRGMTATDEAVYTWGYGSSAGPGGNPSIARLDGESGTTEWQQQVVDDQSGTAAIAADDDGVYFLYDYQSGLSASHSYEFYRYEDGTEVWGIQLEGGHRSARNVLPPTIGDGVVYVNGESGIVTQINSVTGEQQWSGTHSVAGSRIVDDGLLLLGTANGEGVFRRLSANGLVEWTFSLGEEYSGTGNYFSDPEPVDDIDNGFAFADYRNNRFLVVGPEPESEQTDDDTDTPEPDKAGNKETDASSEETTQSTTDTPGSDDTTDAPATDDDGQEQGTSPSSDETDDRRGLFFNGDQRIVEEIDSTVISLVGLGLTVTSFIYQNRKED